MHRVALTETGDNLAESLQETDTSEHEFYPEGLFSPNNPGAWTLADDIIVMLEGPTIVVAVSSAYQHQLNAVIEAVSALGHARAPIALAFRTLCQLSLVDCAYNVLAAIEEAVDVFGALADPVRLQILRATLESPRQAGELSRITGRPKPSLYYHMGKLQEEGLVYSLGHGQGYVADGEFIAGILQGLTEYFLPGGIDGDVADQSG